ncbi:cytochrome P450 [Ganoderma leucocontextum]|nr:cytochrome P450 [Ganoderma leucocontextum]
MPDQWVVVLSGREMVEELRKRPDRELSGTRGLQETFQSQYMCEPLVLLDDYHVDVVKEKLTTMLPTILPDVIDEVVVAVKDHIAARENEWTSVELMQVMQKIVARANHRAFVGLPLCRNEEYLALVVDFAVDVIKGAVALRLCAVSSHLFLNKVKQDTSRAALHLQPIVEERMKNFTELGAGWNDKPNDLLQYILDRETAKSETVFVIAQRLLTLNFAAIHTSSNTITHVLYHLAEKPDLLKPLREEIQASISADGWTSAAMGKMWKLDSILRETLRYHGVGLLAMPRKAMKDITLHDGTRIPKEPGPGRYFAANELKVILAYITLNYDLKLGGDGSRPPDSYIATAVVPAPHGRVLFKKRGRPSG